MINLIIFILALLTLIFGLASMFTPVPGGVFIVAGSISALICTSPKVRSFVRFNRSKFKVIDKMFFWIEKTVGKKVSFVGEALRRTQPGNTEDSCGI